MKRLHVHVGVDDLDRSIGFYSTLFAAQPTVVKTDYAKWMLDDPRVNFAISSGKHAREGIEHLGIQAETATSWPRSMAGSGRGPAGPRGRRHHLLLRQVREELDRRSRRRGLGGLPHRPARRPSMATARRLAFDRRDADARRPGCLRKPAVGE